MSQPIFSRRHYEFIAAMLRDMKPYVSMPPEAIDNMLIAFRRDNPKFDIGRFRKAIEK